MKTALYEKHQNLKAKFVSFAGWHMPLYYKGIHAEVNSVRHHAGLFDVSHMARIVIKGLDTISFLEHLSTNTVVDKSFGKAFYTVFCNSKGFAIDDLLVYLIDKQHAFIVVNASNRDKDLDHLKREARYFQVEIEPYFEKTGILSLQGPKSHSILHRLPSLKPFQFTILGDGLVVSKTGYTGEEGYEFYGTNEQIVKIWDQLLREGADLGIEPCGLGARDILRLEMGYALYGHELSEHIYPLESVAAWTVKLKAHEFLGKKALESAIKRHVLRFPIALEGMERLPAREGYPIYLHGNKIGEITSGSFSPTLNLPIALGMITEKPYEKMQVEVEVRGSFHPFKIVKLPFINKAKI